MRADNLQNIIVIGVRTRTENDMCEAVNAGYENATVKRKDVVFLPPGGDWVLDDQRHLSEAGYAAVLAQCHLR